MGKKYIIVCPHTISPSLPPILPSNILTSSLSYILFFHQILQIFIFTRLFQSIFSFAELYSPTILLGNQSSFYQSSLPAILLTINPLSQQSSLPAILSPSNPPHNQSGPLSRQAFLHGAVPRGREGRVFLVH